MEVIVAYSHKKVLYILLKNRYKYAHHKGQKRPCVHGGYGVTVNAPVCGTGNSGSIPDSRPEEKQAPRKGSLF